MLTKLCIDSETELYNKIPLALKAKDWWFFFNPIPIMVPRLFEYYCPNVITHKHLLTYLLKRGLTLEYDPVKPKANSNFRAHGNGLGQRPFLIFSRLIRSCTNACRIGTPSSHYFHGQYILDTHTHQQATSHIHKLIYLYVIMVSNTIILSWDSSHTF